MMLALSGISPLASAQSLRAPTPAEKAALQKVVNALSLITNSFNDSYWETAENNFDPELYVPAGARPQCGIGYTIKLRLKKDSPEYHKLLDPLLAYLKSAKPDYEKIVAMSKNLQKRSIVIIDIELNSEAIGFGTGSKQSKQLNVAGASKAFIEAGDNNNSSNNGAYVLAFGNWKNAKYDADNEAFRFRFTHPPQTPYIENVTLRMGGDDDKIQEMMRDADWNSLNTALAK